MSINHLGVRLLFMSAREELLKENEAKIKEKEEYISSLLITLARKCSDSQAALSLPGCRKLLHECQTASDERRRAEERLAAVRGASEEYEGRKLLLEEKKKEAAGFSSEIDRLLSSLGAAVYEKCSFSLLDKEAFSFVYADISREDGRKGHIRSVISGLSRERRFRSYGRTVISRDLDSALDGKAGEIALQIRSLYRRRAEVDEEKGRLHIQVGSKRHSYAVLSKDGVERAEKGVLNAASREDEALRSYGAFLFEKSRSWIGDDTAPRLSDDIARIQRERAELDELGRERRRLKREAKADDIMALLESEEKKLSILGKERERIDSEISEVAAEIGRLKSRLDEIRREQES